MASDVVKKDEAQLPDFLRDRVGYTGAEDIENEDITIPRIKIGQAMSAEVKDGDVEEGDLFLNVTGEILAKAGQPLRFTPIARSKEYILWRDRNFEGGGILARAKKTAKGYAWDKPNQAFENRIGGKVKVEWKTGTIIGEDDNLDQWGSEIPGDKDSGIAATAHHNYVVSLPDHDGMIAAFSLARTQTKRAKDLNAMLRMAQLPMYARIFTATTDTEAGDGNTWRNVKFKPVGVVQDKDAFEMFEGMHEHYKGQGFTVDQSDEDSGNSSDTDEAF